MALGDSPFDKDLMAAWSSYCDRIKAAGELAFKECNPATALVGDSIHPTTLGHQQLATAGFAVAVPEPATVMLLVAGLAVVSTAGSRARRRAAIQQG